MRALPNCRRHGRSDSRAADLPPLAPQFQPVVDFSGWYLRGNVGMTNQRVKSLDLVPLPAAFANDTLSTPFLNFDSSSFFGMGVGYQFNQWPLPETATE